MLLMVQSVPYLGCRIDIELGLGESGSDLTMNYFIVGLCIEIKIFIFSANLTIFIKRELWVQ